MVALTVKIQCEGERWICSQASHELLATCNYSSFMFWRNIEDWAGMSDFALVCEVIC